MGAVEVLRQLVALGYIEVLPADRQKALDDTVDELTCNLACSYMDALRYAEAVPYLEKLCARNPENYQFAHALADCCFALGRITWARQLVDKLIEARTQNRIRAEKKWKNCKTNTETA